jgi:hypothetical protein
MAEKTVKVNVDIETNVEPTINNLRELRKQLKSTAAGSEDFKKLSAQIRDVEDAVESAKLGADDLGGALESVPGPIGNIAKAFKVLELNTKSFGLALKATGIGLLVGTVGLLVGAFTKVEGSMKALEPVTIMLEKAMGGLVKAFQPMIEQFAELITFILPPAIKFIQLYYGAQMALFTLIREQGVGVGKIIAGIFTQDTTLLKEGMEQVSKSFSAAGDTFNKFQSDFDAGYAEMSETEKKLAEEEAARRKAQEDARDAALEKEKQRLEERKKLEEDANRVLIEAYKDTLSQRDRDLYEANEKLQQDLKTLELAGVEDRSSVQESYRLKVLEINKKYDDAEAERERTRLEKEQSERDKALQDQLARESQARSDRATAIIADYELRKSLAAQSFEEELNVFQKVRDLDRQELVARKASDDALIAFDKQTARTRVQIETEQQQTKLGIISDALGTLAQAVGENTVAGKALAVAQATISTYQGAALALATYPPPFGAIAAGTVIAAGLLNVRKILSTKVPAPPGTKGLGGGGGSAPSISAPSVPSTATPQFQGGGGLNPTAQIGETLAAAQKPLRAYVVTQDIQSSAALERRTNRAATFSGG